jgi:hypothetical protein
MTKSLYSKNKIEDVEVDLAYCKTRGFSSPDIEDIADKVKKIRELYAKTEEFLNSKKTFNTKLLFQNYSTVTHNTPEEAYLLQLIANGEELLADRNVLGELYTLRDMVASFKERTKEHLNFEEMIHLLNEGFSLNFKTPELYNLFEKAKKILIWTMQAANLIKKYESGFKSKLLTESTNAEPSLQSLLNLPILHGDDYKELQMLTTDHPGDNFQSMELDKLLDLKKRSENWSYKSRHILNTKNFTEEIIRDLLREGENFPTET